jgi:hypothetical protein
MATINLSAPRARRRTVKNRVDLSKPTEEFPCKWKLPRGWNAFRRELPDGGVVAYISGTDTSAFARVYSWPATNSREGAYEAQRRLLNAFQEPVLLDISVPWRKELRLSLWGSTEGDIRQMNFQKTMPDVSYQARAGRIGDRLVAAVVGVRKPDDDEATPLADARDLVDQLEWKLPRSPYGSFARWRN